LNEWKNDGGRGAHVAKVNLSFQEAIKLAEAKTITVAWTCCRVKPIVKTQPTCFNCQKKGHKAALCDAKKTAKKKCFRRQSTDHVIKDCQGMVSSSENRRIREDTQETQETK